MSEIVIALPRPVASQHQDPSPEEIRERCLEIQAEWTPAIRRQRQIGFGYVGEFDLADEPRAPRMGRIRFGR
jgi:hypothetical protein